MTGNRFLTGFLLTALGLGGIVYLWVLLVDPYNIVPFSIPYDREPVTANRRFRTPGLARSERFDSFIIGTSSIGMLRTTQLNSLLGGTFASLVIGNGTPYELQQILNVVVRHHPRIRYAILGTDAPRWCVFDQPYQRFYPGIPFPEWMYDENQWNDLLYLFNWKVLKLGLMEFGYMTGYRKPKYRLDGYLDFLPPPEEFHIAKVRRRLYGEAAPHVLPPIHPPQTVPAEVRAAWTMPTLELLDQMLTSLPESTTKIILLPPRHHTAIPQPGSLDAVKAGECKSRLASVAAQHQNAMVVDFWFRSPLTLEDRNFLDVTHYTVEIATVLGTAIAEAVTEGKGHPGLFEVLGRPFVKATEASGAAGTNGRRTR